MSSHYDKTPRPLLRRTTMSLQAAVDATTNDEHRDQGASMVEYAVLLVLILLAAFFTVQIFGDSLVALFDAMGNAFADADNG